MAKTYVYVVDRDFGFAPNPFHGSCTLATCKPHIRKKAVVGDWVVGMGGVNLQAVGRCVFAMLVTQKMTFDEYWSDPMFLDKKPVRNGSQRMMVGDNIYHHNSDGGKWIQADSHHSNADGSVNIHNLQRDTTTSDKVLISQDFFYFGKEAPIVPAALLEGLNYKNGRGHRIFDLEDANCLIEWLQGCLPGTRNQIIAEPMDFHRSEKRYSVDSNKVT